MKIHKRNNNELTDESLTYLKHICNNDFYKNDREFIGIIKKLTKQTASMSNKAIGLVNILNEAERIKIQMIQKEIDLGLSDKDKPYGQKNLDEVINTTLLYRPTSKKKRLIGLFIGYLEEYFAEEDTEKRKEMLISAKALTGTLRDLGEDPKHFIINRKREKVWYILESDFAKTIKQFDIDLFIEKVRLTRMQYQNDFDEMRTYQEKRKEAINKIIKARESEDHEEINKLQNFINYGMDVEIKPLLIDTQKVMNSLDYMLEDIPSELNSSQTAELQQFIPAISEYYLDQCHRISGGYAHTPLAKNLKHFQKIIDDNLPVADLLDKAEDLDKTMQHLYILHWVGETVLKKILNNGKSMGINIREYKKEFKTGTSFEQIQKSVKIRNDIAHNGLIWNPEEITFAIENYRIYIEKVSKEQKINLNKYTLPKHNQKMTKADIKKNHKNFFENRLKIDTTELEKLAPKYANYVMRTLEAQNWKLDSASIDEMVSRVKHHKQNNFFVNTFGSSSKELTQKLIAYEKAKNKKFDETDIKQVKSLTKSLFWLYYNQEHRDATKVKTQLLKKIQG